MPAIAEDIRREMLDREVAAAGPEAVRVYEEILANGETAEWAAMCALQAAPRTKNTDRTFCDGARRNMDRMSEVNRKKILAIAKKAGINTQGKFYTGIGRYNDPRAWASSQQDVLDTARDRRLDLAGPVNCKNTRDDLPPPKPQPLAEDIVKNRALEMMRADPKLAEKVKKTKHGKRELREQIQAKHSRA